MDEVYKSLIEKIEANLKKIDKKDDISIEDLNSCKVAGSAIDHFLCIMEKKNRVMNPGYSEGVYGHMPMSHGWYGDPNPMSYGQNRSPVTGRYISGGVPHGNMRVSYGDDNMDGYSGHSIKDRMVARLEPMYDEAKSEYERQLVRNTINRIHNEN